jgi:hypothetical protein
MRDTWEKMDELADEAAMLSLCGEVDTAEYRRILNEWNQLARSLCEVTHA